MQALSHKYKGQVLPVRFQGFITMIYSNQQPTPLISCVLFQGLVLHLPLFNRKLLANYILSQLLFLVNSYLISVI